MTPRPFVFAIAAVTGGISLLLTAVSRADSDLASTALIPAHSLPEYSLLADGETLRRDLSRSDDHRYRLDLEAGEVVRIVVEQHGVDVVVETRDPAGAVIADIDDEIRPEGRERVDLVAAATGTYAVDIRASAVASVRGSYAVRLEDRHRATGADHLMQESRRLRTAAGQMEAQGRFSDAQPLLEQALALTERVHGPEHTDVALLLFRLADNALETRDDAAARLLNQRAMAIVERAWGTEHPYVALARWRTAVLDEHVGDLPKGEAALRGSLDIIERTLGTDHLWDARCLMTLARLRLDARDLDLAEDLTRRALAVLERTQNTDTVSYATALNSLGTVYLQRHDNQQAANLFHRSLALAQKLEGPDSYRVSVSLQNLGIVALDQQEYAQALDYDRRALAIRERIVGPDHADIAPLLNNLGVLYHVTGDDAGALLWYSRALQIREKTVGPYHRGTLNALGNLARTYAAIGDISHAIAFEQRTEATAEKQLALNLAAGSERQKLAFVRAMSERTDRTISLHLDLAPRDAGAASLAALVLLQRKGRVQDAMAGVFATIRQHVADPGDRALMDRLNDTNAALAQLALNGIEPSLSATEQRTLADLDAQREQLEAILSEHSAEFRAQAQPVTLDAIQRAVPNDGVLIEFAVFRPFHPRARRNAEAYGPSHYAAYVIHGSGVPAGIDLGETASIDHAVNLWRDALRNPARTEVRARAVVVYEAVVRPLRAALGNARHLIISPDGALNLVPFEALVDEHGRYLIERYATSYVTSGRDLLRMGTTHERPGPPVILADPAFGEPTDDRHTYFAPLAATGLEAQTIQRLFPDATVLTGSRATKGMLQRIRAPFILHIASHGFFLDDSASAGPDRTPLANPLLRSGLALAGANLPGEGRRDGILTALEASGLDLRGTKLVTLSACDTGVGEIRNGEGVYGLRRAFVLAGAETIVMSLWPISDYVARDLMVAYYTGLRAGLGRTDALRTARLAMMKRPHRDHPYFWAGFIQSGDWTSLDGAR